jgi:hypothetical protein
MPSLDELKNSSLFWSDPRLSLSSTTTELNGSTILTSQLKPGAETVSDDVRLIPANVPSSWNRKVATYLVSGGGRTATLEVGGPGAEHFFAYGTILSVQNGTAYLFQVRTIDTQGGRTGSLFKGQVQQVR